MAVIGGGRMPQPERRDLTYAQFERSQGGLLYVLQAVLGTAVFLLLRLPNLSTAMALASVAAGHCLYFLVRWPLWRRLYRQRGHIESHAGLRQARYHLWISLGLTIALPVALAMRGDFGPLLPLTGLILVMWAILAIAGRLPVDAGMLAATAFFILVVLHPDLNAARINPDAWFIAAMSIAMLGARQHLAFMSIKEDGE